MPELVLITGASSDLGIALARLLLEKNADTTVIAHSYKGGARIETLIAEFGERVRSVIADFSDIASVEAMADEIGERYGTPIKIVHLPALRLSYDRLAKFNLERFRQDMTIQVEAALVLLKKFAPKMTKLPASRIVFVLSSVTRNLPPKFISMYTVVKYAQLGLMRAAAAEYAATSLTVNAVSPSMIETQFVEEIGEVAVRLSAAANPQGRNAVPADVIGMIDFLLSPAASYMTGVDTAITGGSYR
jgi:3-oxoacyl-[acyl-carrier protein] reductase